MMNQRPNDRLDLKEFFDNPRETLEESFNPMEDVLGTTSSSLLDTREPCHSGRIVWELVELAACQC